jgi:dipeptidyl aminopeptidase/acylaminoacyl peptidase
MPRTRGTATQPASPERQGRRPIAIEDLYRLRFVSDARISPDGLHVAYVVTWVDSEDRTKYRSQIVLARTDCSAAPRSLTSGRHRDTAPRWSPNGRSLAFLSDRDEERPQLFLLSLEGGEPRQLTRLKHGAGPAVWSPDGSRLAFAAGADIPEIARQEGQSDEKGKPPRVRVITRVKHKGDGNGYFEARRQHLFVLDMVSNGEPRQITSGDWDDSDPAWSPDGERLTFVSSREKDRDLSQLTDIWVVPAAGGRARRVTSHKGEASAPAWSPDGRQIAYLGHERGWTYGALTEILLVPAQGGEPRSLSAVSGCEVGNVALSDGRDPFTTQPPLWAPDGRSMLALISHAGQVSIVRFPVDSDALVSVIGGNREVAGFSVAEDGARLAFVASDPTSPYEVFVAASDGAGERRISHENDDFLASVAVVAPEPFSTRSSDGEDVHGWLLKPVGFAEQKQWPLVLEIHGGPEAMYAWTFMHEFQVLAARGYAVLYTNPRGSRGYGEPFTARIFADWGNQDAADCLAAVEKASALPWVDDKRLGVTGGSYGGFMTAWLVGHTDRFRAAAAQRGCYNFVSFYGTADIGPTFGDYIFGGPVYEKEALYKERSPLSYAACIRTPLLLIHSEGDLRCPVEQAEQFFVHLRRLGKAETEFIRFPEESHNLSRSGRPDRRVERLERIVSWFGRHMK